LTLLRDTRDMTPGVRKAAAQATAFASGTVDKARAVARTAEQAVTDRWITAKVKTHFVGPTLMPDVTVETRDHVVTLKGNVPSSAERERAAGLARDTDGVTRVVNQLEVRSE
jgi:hyperosmotically inducible periplasmic protein